ncbi:phosphoglycerate mutase family protein [Methylococcaceae bacterium WWC4]|nr:phosphoglycerate mutase family protein [Methylococcaceae bacterium WWC4]
MPRIILIRHGRPAVALTGRARARELAGIARAYQNADIVDTPPPATLAIAAGAKRVVCSDLPRARQSARALGFDDRQAAEAVFREAALPHFSSGALKLPISVWLTLLRLAWLAGYARNGESYRNARRRARTAAQRLIGLAAELEPVVLVGHGVINYLIARELRAQGWSGPAKPDYDFWAFAVYQRSGTGSVGD